MESTNVNIFLLLCGIIAILLFILWAKKILRIIIKIVAGLSVILLVVLLVSAVIGVDVLGILSQVASEIIDPQQETIVVDTNAKIRSCPETSCSVIGGLQKGDKILSQGKVDGETVKGNSQWIEFKYEGTQAYVWGGLVSAQPTRTPQLTATKRPVATNAPVATMQPTPTNEIFEDEMWSPKMCSYVYDRPSSPAVRIGRVNFSDTIQVLERVENQGEQKDITWAKFMYNGAVGYINSSRLSPVRPPYFPTKTPVPYSCNCSKKCENLTCAEAFFQLVNCGCAKRDSDKNGVPCNSRCEC